MKDHIHLATGKVFPRGALPTPRHLLAAATPYRPLATIPPYFFILPRTLNMWGNSQYGDCVSAEEAFNKACKGIFIQESEVIRWARANGDLNGANLEPVIQQMQASGFKQDGNVYGDGQGLSVNYADAPTLRSAIYQAGQQGGCVKFALAADQLPSGAGNHNGWFMTQNSPDSNWDHCMGACGYGTAQQFVDAMNASGLTNGLTVPSGVDPNMQGYAIYTWRTIGFSSVQDFVNFTGEAWVRNPCSITVGNGTPTPDSVYVTGDPTPVVCPPGQHVDPVTGLCVPDGPTPPTPPAESVTIPDQVISVPVLFGHHNVTVKGGTYPVNYGQAHASGGSTVTLPPWLLAELRALCVTAPTLGPIPAFIASILCPLLPPAFMAGASATVTIPPILVAVLRFACGFAGMLPPPYGPALVALCAIVFPPQAKCGGCH